MRVLRSLSNEGNTVTVMEGRVSDQAELAGILNTLYELHLPLLSVQYLDLTRFSPVAGDSQTPGYL